MANSLKKRSDIITLQNNKTKTHLNINSHLKLHLKNEHLVTQVKSYLSIFKIKL